MTTEKKTESKTLALMCLFLPLLTVVTGLFSPLWVPFTTIISGGLLGAGFVLLPAYIPAAVTVFIFASVYLITKSYFYALLLIVLIIPPSVAFAIAYRFKRNLNSVVAIMTLTTALFAAALGCSYVYIASGELSYDGLLNALAPVKKWMGNLITEYMNRVKSIPGISDEKYKTIVSSTDELKVLATDYFVPRLPGFIAAFLLLQSFFSMMLAKTILRGTEKSVSHIENINMIRLSKPAGVLFIISYIGYVAIPGPVGLTFSNLSIIMSLAFNCSGISSLYYFASMRKKPYQKVLNLIMLFILDIIPLGCGMFLTITGVFDTFFNYRKVPDPSDKDVI